MEAVTWRQLAIHEKPSGVLNVDGYFANLGLSGSRHRDGIHPAAQRSPDRSSDEPRTLLDTLVAESQLA